MTPLAAASAFPPRFGVDGDIVWRALAATRAAALAASSMGRTRRRQERGPSCDGRHANDECAAVDAAGIDTDRILELDELRAAEGTFVATGITGGLLAAPRHQHGLVCTDSIVIGAGAIHHIRQTTAIQE